MLGMMTAGIKNLLDKMPPFSQVNATAQDLVTPPGTVRRFALDARLNHVAPLRAHRKDTLGATPNPRP